MLRNSYVVRGLVIGVMAMPVFFDTVPALAQDTVQAAAQETMQRDLVIQAEGFVNADGQAVANLFREVDDVFHKPYLRVTAKIEQGKARLVFPALKYGDYAVTVFHDENGNGELDHNALHFPAEPLGFSNGFHMGLFSGFPNFEKLRFSFSPGTQPVLITVK